MTFLTILAALSRTVVADNEIAFILLIIFVLFLNSENSYSDIPIIQLLMNSPSVDGFPDFIILWGTKKLTAVKLVSDCNQLLNLEVDC